MPFLGHLSDLHEVDRGKLAELLRPLALRSRSEYVKLAQLSEAVSRHDNANGTDWTERHGAELHVLLTEYKSLRQESLNTITNRVQVMILGLAAMGALAGGAMTSEGISRRPALVTAVFSGAIPVFACFIFLAWLSEAVRSHRAGYFLASWLEPRINALVGKLTLSFEASLWTGLLPRDELGGPSMMALAILGFVAASAPLLGLVISNRPFGFWGGSPIPQVWGPWIGLAVVAVYSLSQMHRLKNKSQLVAAVSGETSLPGDAGETGSSRKLPNER